VQLGRLTVPIVVAALFAGALVPSGEGGTAAVPAGRLSQLRVCPYESFDRVAQTCKRDQRRTTLFSTRFACSAAVDVRTPGRLLVRMLYNGEVAYQFTTRPMPIGVSHPWIAYNLGTVPLPGGSWACDFTFAGKTIRAAFRSRGPTGTIIGAAVCGGNETIRFGSSRRLLACRSDRSGSTIAASEVVCSGVLPGSASKELRIALLSGGTEVGEPYAGPIGGTLWLVWATFTPPGGGRTFAPGAYVCQFSVDGVTVAEKPFRVG
jgi:hypothetical protein